MLVCSSPSCVASRWTQVTSSAAAWRSAVEGERIDGPRFPRGVAQQIGRAARLHPADDARSGELLDRFHRLHARTVEGIRCVELGQSDGKLRSRRDIRPFVA